MAMSLIRDPLHRLQHCVFSAWALIASVQVLEPVQCAKLIVQAYPFPPDLLSVISTIVKEAGEPAAADLLAMRPAAPSLASFQLPISLQ